MYKTLIVFCCLSIFLSKANAQDIELSDKWTSRIQTHNGNVGFFEQFETSNEKYVYALFNDYLKKDIHLVAFDKKNLTNSLNVQLYGKKNKKRRRTFKHMNYVKTICVSNNVFIFWARKVQSAYELHAEIYDTELNLITPLKKVGKFARTRTNIFSPTATSTMQSSNPSIKYSVGNYFNIQVSDKSGGRIMIATEVKKKMNMPVEFNYLILNSELEEVTKGEIELEVIKRKYNLKLDITGLQNCEYGIDGKFYLKHLVRKENKFNKKEDVAVLSIIDPEEEAKSTFDIKFEDKEVLSFDWISDENGMQIYGYFSDLKLDPKAYVAHGLFYIYPEESQISEPKFSYFKQELVEEFSDMEKKVTFNLLATDQFCGNSYLIEKIERMEDGSVFIYSSTSSNYYTYNHASALGLGTGGYGGGATTGQPQISFKCKKKDVLVYKLNADAELEWYSKIERTKKYTSHNQNVWNVKDLKIMHDNNSAYVVYGSELKTKRNAMVRKNAREKRDEIEYAVFDLVTGNSEVKNLKINTDKPKSKELKRVNLIKTELFDNEIFVNSTKQSLRPGYMIASGVILAGIVVACTPILPVLASVAVIGVGVPTLFIWTATGKHAKMVGHVGKISLRKN